MVGGVEGYVTYWADSDRYTKKAQSAFPLFSNLPLFVPLLLRQMSFLLTHSVLLLFRKCLLGRLHTAPVCSPKIGENKATPH
jgi:hypothetical protein